MPGELLLDTGAIIGLLDRSQSVHTACTEFFATWNGPIITTEAVLTEACHLLSGLAGGPAVCLDFILDGGVLVIPSTQITLRRCRTLLEKYSDVPMDFADATLVVLAEEANTDVVFTVDRNFRIYRIRGRRQFKVFPDKR